MAKRDNVIINRLNKTKREAKLTTEEFRAEREKRDKLERDEKKKVFKQLGMLLFYTYIYELTVVFLRFGTVWKSKK